MHKHSFHCHQTGFVLFQTPRFQEVKEANGLCSEVFRDIHQLFALQKQPNRSEEPNFPGFLLSCITAVLEFTNPTELEHKKRMAEIKDPTTFGWGQRGWVQNGRAFCGDV